MMTESEKAEKISAALKAAAARALMIDPDDALKLADVSKVKLRDDGEVEGADQAVAELKAAKPFLCGKHAREMTETERAAALNGLRHGPKPAPLDLSKTARQMTKAEREAFVRECARRA